LLPEPLELPPTISDIADKAISECNSNEIKEEIDEEFIRVSEEVQKLKILNFRSFSEDLTDTFDKNDEDWDMEEEN